MAKSFISEILPEIDDPRQLRDTTVEFCNEQWRETDRQLAAGRITPELAADARCNLAELYLNEIANDPMAFRRATKADEFGQCEFDRIRELAGGYNNGYSPDDAERRRQRALEVVMANRAEEMFAGNRIDAEQYTKIMSHVAPEVVAEPEVEQAEQESGSDWTPEQFEKYCETGAVPADKPQE